MSHNEVSGQSSIDELAHAFEEEEQVVDLGAYAPEDWFTLIVFWGTVVLVFLQFFTRYALNNSLAWTEEVAVNSLIVLVFMGAAMCTRTTRHIHVDLLYHHVGQRIGRWLSRLVDVVKLAFFVYATWLMWRYVSIVADERLISVRLSRGWFLYPMLAAFALMALRSAQVLVQNWRRGYSVLERPELAFIKGE